MIRGFSESYGFISKRLRDVALLSPAMVIEDSMLKKSVGHADALCRIPFARCFPQVVGCWGVEDDRAPNAYVCFIDGEANIVLTRGALDLFDSARCSLIGNPGLSEMLVSWAFGSEEGAASISSDLLGETLQLFSIAALFGHEIGHAVDRFYVTASVQDRQSLVLAEEISADGHAAFVGLQIADAWAKDLSDRHGFSYQGFRRLAAVVLVLGNSLLDDICFDRDWRPSAGETHPPGLQRLLSFCLHVNEHFHADTEGWQDRDLMPVGIASMLLALQALSELGLRAEPDLAALDASLANYDHNLIQRQFDAIQKALNERFKIA